MRTQNDVRTQSHSTIIILLIVAALLPLLFNSAGVVAGCVLGLMVLGWLLRAGDGHVRNRLVLLVLAALVLAMNGAFLIGVVTNGTWQF